MEQEAALRRQLETELEQKTVEIEELQGRLSVRMMDRLLFDSGSADISGGGAAVLAKVGPVLAGGKEMIRVEGHTDDLPVGPGLKSMYFSNWELSAARAASVVRYLQYGQGIDPARLETVGLGGYRPLESNDTSAGRRRNRRVEIVLLPQR
jgi:chemotaxis protein MotB